MPAAIPSLAQVRATTHALTLTVPPEFQDINGHMNIRHYMATHDDAAVHLFNRLGFDEQFVAMHRRYFFDLEHHLSYQSEILIGDEISVYARFIARTDKLIHYIAMIADHRTGLVANTMEVLTAHVDLATRQTVPLNAEETRILDRLITEHQELDWPPPLSGSMALRPSAIVNVG